MFIVQPCFDCLIDNLCYSILTLGGDFASLWVLLVWKIVILVQPPCMQKEWRQIFT
jgi:hypothetical protein